MKKILAFVLTLLMLASTFIPVNASENTGNTYFFGDVTVQFEEGCTFSDEQQEHIAYHMANGDICDDDSSTTYNLLCTLFGHKYETSTSYVTTHKVYTTAPKCVQKTYLYSLCSRCDDTKSELQKSTRVNCCP